jgi:hypothetical protein
MTVAFGVPLLLTAMEAAEQRVLHASGSAAWAPLWLMFLNIAGFIVIVAASFQPSARAENPERFSKWGMCYCLIYLIAFLSMAAGMDWRPYRN